MTTPSSTPQTHIIDLTPPSTPLLSGHLKLGGVNPQGRSIEFNSQYMLNNGTPCIPVMGEIHYSRVDADTWDAELLKMKAGGITIVATYIFWIHIEEDEGVFEWSGNNNLRRFIELCAKHELDVIIRIGPFDHGECRNGGFPDWIYGRPFELRSTDARFLAYVHRLYQQIADQVSGLLFKDNGPIIGVQLDNEYMHCGAPWETTFKPGTAWVTSGSEGAAYLIKLKELARAVGLDVPIYTVTGWLNSPLIEDETLPMQGGYAFTPWSPDPNYRQAPTREFLFRNRHLDPVLNGKATYDGSRYPLVCCEIGGGIQITYYHRPIVPPQSVEALALMNLGSGSNLIGYYMYHGGTNPIGKHAYLNEFTVPRLSYDFQAPIREFGQMAESYRYLRVLHRFLADFGDLLAPMTVSVPENASTITPENTTDLRWTVRSKDGSGFIFLNNYQDHVEMQDLHGLRFQFQTAAGILTIPQSRGLTLQKDTCAILPFGLSLNGIHLRYATTQLLTKLKLSPSMTLYVFFAPHGMTSEYAFDTSVSVDQADIERTETMTIVRVTAGLESLFTLTSPEGQHVRILTLTRQQAEGCTKQTLFGRDHLIISDGELIVEGDTAWIYGLNRDESHAWFCPQLESTLTAAVGDIRMIDAEDEGMFTHMTFGFLDKDIAVEVETISSTKVVIKLPSDALDGVDNVLLRIDYVGDVGNAYVDGRLIADHFYNGLLWEIGLKQANPELHDIVLIISPLVQNAGGARYVQTGMAFRPDTEGESLSVIRSVTAVASYKVALQ